MDGEPRRAPRSHRCAVLVGLALLAAGCAAGPQVPIFLWHSVGEGSSAQDVYDLSPDEFDQELTLLDRYGATAISLDALFDARAHGKLLPRRAVVLTFDDGRQSLYLHAFPILKKHHAVGEFFVVTGFLGEDEAHRVRRVDQTGLHPYLTWPELEEMVRSGTVIAESHSRTHPRLPSLGANAQRDEILRSGQLLRERLQVPVHFFAYPFGSWDETSRELARSAGYRAALSVSIPDDYSFAVPRTSIHRGAFALFQETLEKAFGPVPSVPPSP